MCAIQVVIPYVKGLSESIGRIFTRFGANVASRPIRTVCSELMYPKDKVDYEEVSECIYQIPCKNCDKFYVGETARNIGMWVGEHKKEVESKDMLRFTLISKNAADEQQNKSTVTDHATRENHIIDWNGVKGHWTQNQPQS